MSKFQTELETTPRLLTITGRMTQAENIMLLRHPIFHRRELTSILSTISSNTQLSRTPPKPFLLVTLLNSQSADKSSSLSELTVNAPPARQSGMQSRDYALPWVCGNGW